MPTATTKRKTKKAKKARKPLSALDATYMVLKASRRPLAAKDMILGCFTTRQS